MILEFNKHSVRNGALGNGDRDLVFSNLRNSGSQRANMQTASAVLPESHLCSLNREPARWAARLWTKGSN
jgi:hypothetical protein